MIRNYIVYDDFLHTSVDEYSHAVFARDDAVHVERGAYSAGADTSCIGNAVGLSMSGRTLKKAFTGRIVFSFARTDVGAVRKSSWRPVVASRDNGIVANKQRANLAGKTRGFARDCFTDCMEVFVPALTALAEEVTVSHCKAPSRDRG